MGSDLLPTSPTNDQASNVRFTPGPWVVTHDDGRAIICAPDPDGRRTSIGCVWRDIAPCEGSTEANAAMMAAAPEMYVALRLLKDRRCADFTLDEWKQIDAALAKAEARSLSGEGGNND